MSKKVIPFPGRATTTRLADPRRLEFEHAGEQIAAIIRNPYTPPFVRKALNKALIDIACHQSALGPGINSPELARMIWEHITPARPTN